MELNSFNIEKYKCNLCRKCLKEPYLTKCGHKFCKICILDNLKVNKECPQCQHPLVSPSNLYNKDRFPDTNTEREINELKLSCPNSEKGCILKLSLYEYETHEKLCKFGASNNDKLYCVFYHAGCTEEFSDQNEYQAHLANSSTKHFSILLGTVENLRLDLNKEKELNKQLKDKVDNQQKTIESLKQQINIKTEYCFEASSLSYRLGNLNNKFESLQDSVKGLIVDSVDQEADLEKQNDLIQDLSNQMMIHTSGSFVWTIEDFESDIISNYREYSSSDFSATPYGYMFAIELKISKKKNISVFLAMQRYDHNDNLMWPFHAKYQISIIHPSYNAAEHYESGFAESSFKRPSIKYPSSWGWNNFVGANYLKKNGFLLNDTLIIKATIRSS